MSKLSVYAVAIFVGLGTSALLAASSRIAQTRTSAEVRFAADGAYRDGLYLGKLAAESGQQARPAIGRWSTDHDRALFTAGFTAGYGASPAARSH